MMKAVLFDSCASAAIEAVCDNLQKELQQSYPYLTDRYSCGYGDLPITLQASSFRRWMHNGVLDSCE